MVASSQGGLPRMQSNPARSRRNTSGKASGKWSDRSSSANPAASAESAAARDYLLGDLLDRLGTIEADCDKEVEELASGLGGELRFRYCLLSGPNLCCVGVARPREAREDLGGAADQGLDPVTVQGRRGAVSEADGSSTGAPRRGFLCRSGCPADQGPIEEAQRQTGNECVNPDCEPRQLNRDQIAIDAVDAAPRHLPAQQAGMLDLDTRSQSPRCSSAAFRSLSSSAITAATGRSARKLESRASIRSTAATRKCPEPIAISAQRKSKKAAPAAASSPVSISSVSRSMWPVRAGSRA